ncbi:MAG: hypothetical protein VX640_04305 [Pseudomonadota bacterium]|nr:hypothetical protein [Pseudomonadota bacterium]
MTHPPSLSEREALLKTALAYFDAYGADLARWPEQARRTAEALAGDARFEAARETALALDRDLALVTAPAAGDALKERMLAAAPGRRPSQGAPLLASLFAGRRFAPAGALAGLTALGFAAGMVSTPGGASAQEEALAYAEAAIASTLSEEDAFWAIEQ